MLYPFMTLDDGTEIVHSEPFYVDGKEKVRVVFEKPVYGGFKHAECIIPDYSWEDVSGYSSEEIDELLGITKDLSAVIINLARNGGFDNASSF
ncbi:MAG: hypothetical protein SPL57_06555 [Lachnospiraceae bacterium]|nr:hypothetical protein [Lachnospiraceae bacterium]